MSAQHLLLLGTKKGLFWFTSFDRRDWQFHGPFLNGKEINHAYYDPRNARIYATANDSWFGSEIVWSSDQGQTWTPAKINPSFPEDSGLKLERIWHLEPGLASEPSVVYAGVAPAALFRSEDGGESWREVSGLTRHPTRPRWHPGAGGLCLHSIVTEAANPLRLWVAISAVGTFRSDDGGASWITQNKNVRAEFLPERYPEHGQCVHKLLRAVGGANLLFQQNHCGVYRSADAGESWQEITAGLPSDFGFSLALHPREPATLYVLPLQSAEFRCPPERRLRLYRSRDGGQTWQPLMQGLPQNKVFMGSYREAMATDQAQPAGIYLGTNTGTVYASIDEGDLWYELALHLPPIYSVATGVLE